MEAGLRRSYRDGARAVAAVAVAAAAAAAAAAAIVWLALACACVLNEAMSAVVARLGARGRAGEVCLFRFFYHLVSTAQNILYLSTNALKIQMRRKLKVLEDASSSKNLSSYARIDNVVPD